MYLSMNIHQTDYWNTGNILDWANIHWSLHYIILAELSRMFAGKMFPRARVPTTRACSLRIWSSSLREKKGWQCPLEFSATDDKLVNHFKDVD